MLGPAAAFAAPGSGDLAAAGQKCTYLFAPQGETAECVELTAEEAVDYPLYFDGETGRLYKTFSYDFNTGKKTFDDPVEILGAKCAKNKLTLTSAFQFYTNREDALYLGEGTTLYVPAGEKPTIYGAFSGLNMSNDNIGGSSGIFCLGDNTLDIDGELTVWAGGGKNISSWAILNADKDTALNITGKGILTARGGKIEYDATVDSRGDSVGITSYGDVNVSIAELNAIGGESYAYSVGIDVDYPASVSEPRKLTISGGAHVNATGGVCSGANTISIGCATNHINIKDASRLEATAAAASAPFGLMLFDGGNYGAGLIELSGGSSLTAAALASDYGCGIVSRSGQPISAKMTSGCTFTAAGAGIAALPELAGVIASAGGQTVQYDGEKFGYFDANGNPVKEISFTNGASSGGGGGGRSSASASASVSSGQAANGSFSVSDKNAKAGAAVKVTPQADEGYVVDAVTATDKNGRAVAVKPNGDGTYSFVMPEKAAQPVSVEVTFKPAAAEKDTPPDKFSDVAADAWYSEAVDYVVAHGLMSGTSAGSFAPNAATTRAMLVTILYRLEGEPGATKNLPFADVAAGAWYADAVNWASTNGIVAGYGENVFGPNDPITRAQMAAILYRYAELKGYDVAGTADLAGYADTAALGGWAAAALRWSIAAGLIEGTAADTLSPNGSSTRAQSATILLRFCEGVAK